MKLDNLQINLSSREVTVRKTEIEKRPVLQKLSEVYSEHAKLVFLFDVSGSMDCHVAHTFTDQYKFTPEVLAAVRARVARLVNIIINDPMAIMLMPEADQKVLRLRDDVPGPNGEATFAPVDDEELKERIVRHDLIGELGIEVDWTKHSDRPMSRMELVRKLAKSELENRFKKFPKSRIAVVPFASSAKAVFDDGAEEDLWPVLDELGIGSHGIGSGSTDILGAIKRALDTCRKSPSAVGIHHFVVVSDGQDSEADCTIGSWVPSLKASGVTMDYIHLGDQGANEGLKAACEALGGEFVVCTTEKDFQTKFVEKVSRPLLPAGAAV